LVAVALGEGVLDGEGVDGLGVGDWVGGRLVEGVAFGVALVDFAAGGLGGGAGARSSGWFGWARRGSTVLASVFTGGAVVAGGSGSGLGRTSSPPRPRSAAPSASARNGSTEFGLIGPPARLTLTSPP